MKKVLIWVLAFVITAGSAVYQRITGPTYAVSGNIQLGGSVISFTLETTHETIGDYEINIEAPDSGTSGYVQFKRFKTGDPWTNIPMERKEGSLTASLPQQPSSGKLAYKVFLSHNGEEVSLTGEDEVVIRFKDVVPDIVLILHIITIFAAMLLSTRTGIEALNKDGNTRKLTLWTAGFMFAGGMILGPIVQKFAFGEWWTGFPFGFDLTDNKTLIAMIVWAIAVIAGRKGKQAKGWVLAASIVTLVIFLIPHSLLGSELDYSQIENQVSQTIAFFIPKF
ncbi:MAG: hypothetical protein MUP98_18060 [Candidatus Aminicenantes bacterium]|nr:hypothetical protein [Candidatus Aminicenantes bacterium]